MLEVTVAVRLVWVEVAVVVSHTSKQLLSTGSMWVCSGHLDLSIAENDDSPTLFSDKPKCLKGPK